MSELINKCCPVCFVGYAIPKAMNDKRHADGGNWFCPNGHNLVFSESKLDKLTHERDRLKQNAAYLEQRAAELQDARDAAERRASAARGQVTRLKNRAAAGLCPCCNRSFVNLTRHMATKHAGFAADVIDGDAPRTIQ